MEAASITSMAAASMLEGHHAFPKHRSLPSVWFWFRSLQSERQSNGMGYSPLSSSQIRDWEKMWRWRLPLWAFRMIRRIDDEYMDAMNLEPDEIMKALEKLEE
jgi:hypothetical protein